MNIDLHMHTRYSDGTDTGEELVKLICDNKIDVFSVTDHDSTLFYSDIRDAVSHNDLHIPSDIILIPGIELTCQHDGAIRDILGYGIDVDMMQKWLDDNYSLEKRIEKQKHIVRCLKQAFSIHDIKFNESVDAYEGKKSEAYVAMLTNIISYPENIEKRPSLSNISTFYCTEYSNPESDFYVNEACDAPTIPQAIDLIHKAGGLAFVAHPYKYRMSDEKTLELIALAIRSGVDGIELKHSSNADDDVKKIKAIAEKYNLLICGGSDFHGTLKPEIELVTGQSNNMKVEYDEIAPWIEAVRHW